MLSSATRGSANFLRAVFRSKLEIDMLNCRQMSRAAGVLLFALVSMLLAGCSRPLISGVFVRQVQPPGVEMFRLVESPRGHLSGSFVGSSLNEDGSRKDDEVYNVTGTISGSNVVLELNGGLATIARWLGGPTNFVGTLKGGVLIVNSGNQTEQFEKVSERQYNAMVADLQQRGKQMAEYRAADSALAHARQGASDLNQDLRQYVQWAQLRVDRVSSVQLWYADRLKRYSACLSTIRPLAAAHVPAWRWQACVLGVENDRYYRDQEAQLLRDDQAQNLKAISTLRGRINTIPAQIAAATERLNSACPYAPNEDICRKEAQTMRGGKSNGLIDERLLSSFQSVAPEAERALEADVQTSSSEGAKLAAVAQQIDSTYHGSMNN